MKITKAVDMKRTKDWRIMIYAKPGTGKTSAVNYLQGKTLVLDLDGSAKVLAGVPGVDVVNFDRVHPSEEITQFLKDAPAILKNYDNLVVDNISSFEKDWFVERGKGSHNGISNEMQDYSIWTNFFARIMTTIYLWKDINILVTAWENTRDVTTEQGQKFSQYAPQIRDNVRDGLMGLTDVVGRVVINAKTGGRGVILEGGDAIYAKNRLDDRKLTAIEDLFPGAENNKELKPNLKAGDADDVSVETVSKKTGDGSKKLPSRGE